MRGTVRTAAGVAVVLLAAVLVAAGCGTGHGPGTHRMSTLAVAGRAPATGSPVAGSPAPGAAPTGPPVVGKAQAEQMTQALLARAQPPPGAQVLAGRPPGQDLARPPDVQAGSPSAGRHRLWRVAEPASAAYAFVTKHVPTGMVWAGSGQSGYRGGVTEQSVSYRPRQLPAGVAAALLTVTVAPAGPEASVLRADSQVIWYPTRSAAEHVPAGMHTATVTATVAGRHPRTVTATVSSPSLVRRLAAILNGAHAAAAGSMLSCPLDQVSYRIAFAVSPSAVPYLVATATTCPDLQVTAGGHRQPALQVPAGLLPLLHRLTGMAAQLIPPGK